MRIVCSFDNANKNSYKVKKSKIDEIQFKEPKLDIKPIFSCLFLLFKFLVFIH